jgi:hypothetical protein
MKRFLAYLAGTGFILSLLWHLLSWFGLEEWLTIPGGVLFAGVFIVSVPAFFLDPGEMGPREWMNRAAMGAPAWMPRVATVTFWYALLNFGLAYLLIRGSSDEPIRMFSRVGSGYAMAFYAIDCMLLYAAAVREESRE